MGPHQLLATTDYIRISNLAYANLTYTITDSDADGIYDPFELDADNDGCNDVLEAGYSDNNNDGILAALPTVVNSNGLVTGTSVIDGYTTPDDNNSNSTYDFQEASSLPTITLQPINTATCPGCSATISVTATNATPADNGNQYRVVLTNIGYVCGTTISNTATLTVRVNTVITNRRITYRVKKN